MPARKLNRKNFANLTAFLIKSADLVKAMKHTKPGPGIRPPGPNPFGTSGFRYVRKRVPGKRPTPIRGAIAVPPVGPGAGGPIPTPPVAPPVGPGGTRGTAARILLWRKENLSDSDAQIPGTPKSKTKGSVTLGKEGFRIGGSLIDPLTYFRTTIFGALIWTGTPNGETTASIRVVILGVDQGVHNFKISHDLNRVAKQKNVPTWLHWGRTLNAYLRKHSVVGRTLHLYRGLTSDGADFFLEIV